MDILILVDDADPVTTTLADFLRDNDEMDAAEIAQISDAMAAHRDYVGGGGAAAGFTIRRAVDQSTPASRPKYMVEFPDFDDQESAARLLDLGFEDGSWGNESCPAFAYANRRIFVDFIDPERREFPEADQRFTLHVDFDRAGVESLGANSTSFDTLDDLLVFILSEGFVEELKTQADVPEWEMMLADNATETDPRICHSHDFCDANMAMLGSWNEAFGREPLFLKGTDESGAFTTAQEVDNELWDRAWDRAKYTRLGGERPVEKVETLAENAAGDRMEIRFHPQNPIPTTRLVLADGHKVDLTPAAFGAFCGMVAEAQKNIVGALNRR